MFDKGNKIQTQLSCSQSHRRSILRARGNSQSHAHRRRILRARGNITLLRFPTSNVHLLRTCTISVTKNKNVHNIQNVFIIKK